MPYIGKTPLTGAYQLCDAIVTSATATYNLLVGGSAVIPGAAQNCIVSLNGVVQAPVGAYTVSGSTITFASTLSATDVIDFILILGNVFDIGKPTDGSVTNASVSASAAIAYSKLNLGTSIVNADVSASAAIALSKLATTGTMTFASTIGVGGATPAASGAGVSFPATASASTDANTLDDYEEGTWTIAVQGSSTNPTVGYNFRVGTYVKVGKNVTLNGHFRTSSVAGGSGDVLITGLPFAVDNTSNYTTVGVCYTFNTATSKFPYYVRLDNGGTSITLYYGSGTVQSTSLVVSDLGTGSFSNETAFTINYLATA